MTIHTRHKRGRLLRHRGIPGRLDATPVAAHLRLLLDSGWTRLQIADASGVSERAIRYILNGQPTVQRPKHAALLALAPRQDARVRADGTRRRIQALACMGWPITRTARLAGCSHNHAFQILGGGRERIAWRVADGYARVYRDLAHRRGPSEFTRTIARRNGWHGPLAWDRGAIDDPRAVPDVDVVPALRPHQLAAVIADEVRHLDGFGVPVEEIARRVDRSVGYVREQLAGRRGPGWRHRQDRTGAVA